MLISRRGERFWQAQVVHLVVMLLAFALGTPVRGQTSDITAPILQSFQLDPTSVDVSTASRVIGVTTRFTDDLSGTSLVLVTFRGPTGVLLWVQPPRTAGTPLDGRTHR